MQARLGSAGVRVLDTQYRKVEKVLDIITVSLKVFMVYLTMEMY